MDVVLRPVSVMVCSFIGLKSLWVWNDRSSQPTRVGQRPGKAKNSRAEFLCSAFLDPFFCGAARDKDATTDASQLCTKTLCFQDFEEGPVDLGELAELINGVHLLVIGIAEQ
jgi:hypothetical protein